MSRDKREDPDIPGGGGVGFGGGKYQEKPVEPGDRYRPGRGGGGSANKWGGIDKHPGGKKNNAPKRRFNVPKLPRTGGGGGGGVAPRRPTSERLLRSVPQFDRQKHPLRAFYGPRHLTGAFVRFYQLLGNGQRLVVYWWSWGPINSLSGFIVDKKSFSELGLAPGVHYNVYLGTGSSAADPLMTANVPQWSTLQHPPDVAQLVVLYPRPSATFPNVNVARIECDGEGLLYRDPVLDATLATRFYGANPVLQALDIDCDTRFGGGYPVSKQDWFGTVTEARNDAAADLGGGRLRYMPAAIELDTTEDYEPCMEMVRGHCALNYNFSNGKKLWWIDKARSATGVTFTDQGDAANIVKTGPLEVKGAAEIPTRVIVWYTNSDAGGKRDHVVSVHPLLASGGVELVEWVYEFKGILKHDPAQRIADLIRKRASVDKGTTLRTLSEGMRVLPGSRITVASLVEHNWTNVDVLVTDTEPTPGRSTWDIKTEVWSDSVHDDTQKTTTSLIPPANPSPFDIPDPPRSPAGASSLTMGDGFVPQPGGVNVTWTAPDIPYAEAFSYRVTRQSATEAEAAVTGDVSNLGPVFVKVGEMPVTIRVYAISAALLVSVALSGTAQILPAHDVLEPVLSFPATGAELSCLDPQVRSDDVYGAAFWSGTATITPALVNNGDKAVVAATFTAGQTLIFDSGVGVTHAFRELRVSAATAVIPASSSPFTLEISADGTTWTTLTPSHFSAHPRYRTAFTSAFTDEIVYQLSAVLGSQRKIRLTALSAFAISEVQVHTFEGAWDDYKGVNVYDMRSGTPLRVASLAKGPTSNIFPLKVEQWYSKQSTTNILSIMVRTFNSAGVESAGLGVTKASTHLALASEAPVTEATSQTFYGKSFDLANNTMTGTMAQFNTAVTDGDFVFTGGAQMLSGKTIALGSNTITGTKAEFNAAMTDADFATLDGVETLTNKTLTSPAISTIANGGTLTLPMATDTLVGRATTDTLTNKTINLANNTVTGTLAQLNAVIGGGQSLQTETNTGTLTNKTFNLANNTLTGTTAQFNAALSDGDFATRAGGEILTNKGIDFGTNTLTMTKAQANTALSDDNFAFLGAANIFTALQQFTGIRGAEALVLPTAGNNNDLVVGDVVLIAFGGNPGAAISLTGIAGGSGGKLMVLWNVTGQALSLTHNDVLSTAANRFSCKNAVPTVLAAQGGAALLMYSSAISRWVVIAIN